MLFFKPRSDKIVKEYGKGRASGTEARPRCCFGLLTDIRSGTFLQCSDKFIHDNLVHNEVSD